MPYKGDIPGVVRVVSVRSLRWKDGLHQPARCAKAAEELPQIPDGGVVRGDIGKSDA